jgi:uncharacterized protein
MKIPLSIALVAIAGVVLVQAAPPTDESINEMLRVVQVEKMLNQMLTQMDSGMKTGVEQALQQSLHGQELTAAQKTAVENFRQKVSAIMKEELSFAKMKDLYAQVYRETFTQEEVNSIIAFYGSAAGKAMVEKIPVAMQKAGTLMQARIGPMTQKIQAMQEEFLKEMSKTK